MSVARIHNWISLEALTASDLNAEFNNLINYLNSGAITLTSLTLAGSLTMPSVSVSGTNTSNAMVTYQEGAWTPVDSSGAGLTFTVTKATYTRIGRQVSYVLKLTFPATADTSIATIGGLPFTAAALSSGLSPYISDSGSAATFPVADVLAGTTTIQLLNLAGSSGATNANMSGKILVIFGSYVV